MATSSLQDDFLFGLDLPDFNTGGTFTENFAAVEQESENKRVRINRAKHKRVHSDPNVLSSFSASQQHALYSSAPPMLLDPVNELEQLPQIGLSGIAEPPQQQHQRSSVPARSNSMVMMPPVLEEMDEFLNMFNGSELEAIGNIGNSSHSLGGLQPGINSAGRVIQEMESIKAKRKRSHQRHHSNPVGLLHNLDQVRQMAAAANGGSITSSVMSIPETHATTFSQDDTSLYGAGGLLLDGSSSDFTTDFLGNPLMSTSGGGNTKSQNSAADNRRQYKCGRCGQPKVGHKCTMPDQRNNHSQVDLQITKGLKAHDISHKTLSVKKPWVASHPDNHFN